MICWNGNIHSSRGTVSRGNCGEANTGELHDWPVKLERRTWYQWTRGLKRNLKEDFRGAATLYIFWRGDRWETWEKRRRQWRIAIGKRAAIREDSLRMASLEAGWSGCWSMKWCWWQTGDCPILARLARWNTRKCDSSRRRERLDAAVIEELLHSLAQISSELRRESSCQDFAMLLLCGQIDREEKLHESIPRRRRGSNRAAVSSWMRSANFGISFSR